jgi:hypothetical protein
VAPGGCSQRAVRTPRPRCAAALRLFRKRHTPPQCAGAGSQVLVPSRGVRAWGLATQAAAVLPELPRVPSTCAGAGSTRFAAEGRGRAP